MEAVLSFETSVKFYNTKRWHVAEGTSFHNHHCEGLQWNTSFSVFLKARQSDQRSPMWVLFTQTRSSSSRCVSILCVTIDGVWIRYWIYWHSSELQVITELLLISTLYNSPQHTLRLFSPAVLSAVPWKRLLTAKTSAPRAQVLPSPTFVQNWLPANPSTELDCHLFSAPPAKLICSHHQIKVKVKVTLLLTVSQSVSLGVEPIWASWPDIYYSLTITVLFLWGSLLL
jgi:hypothetical protein